MNWINRLKGLRPSQGVVVGIPYIWLLLLFLVPFIIVLKISFAEQDIAIPPYTPLYIANEEMGRVNILISYQNYSEIFNDFWHSLGQMFLGNLGNNTFLLAYWLSIKTAFITTFICLLTGYPIAYTISRAPERYRNGLLLAIMLPFWTSFLLRVYAWISLLGRNGIINTYLLKWGIIDSPIDMFYNNFSLILVMVYAYLPFMILPLYTQLVKLDNRYLEAAADLGAGPIKTFCSVTLPLSKAGIISGSMLVFIPAIGEFVIPELVGGTENQMIGKVLWQTFFNENNWPLASALAVIMVLLLVIPIVLFHRFENREIEKGSSHA